MYLLEYLNSLVFKMIIIDTMICIPTITKTKFNIFHPYLYDFNINFCKNNEIPILNIKSKVYYFSAL